TAYDVEIDFLATGYRLPTEAEWECAAHGGASAMQTAAYTKFAGSDSLDLVGWFYDNSTTPEGVRRTHPVAQKMKNAAGFCDLSGNVWEWCQDWHGEQYYKEFGSSAAKNPQGPVEDVRYRVLRGGSWIGNDDNSRAANRGNNFPDYRLNDFGFRAARH
ncbi:MAG: formylglycine-generating enzyme family protein, partial [Saprospiraceae bacterium]